MRDDELVRRIAAGDWAPDDDAATHRRPAVAQIVELVRRRRRRRRVAAVGGAGLACVSVVVAMALVPGASETGTVPPAGTSRTPVTPPTTAATETPEGRLCPNNWVVNSLGTYEGGGGLRQPVEISNIGRAACSVPVPTLSLVPDSGPPVPVRGPLVEHVMLKPGTTLSLMVGTATMCNNAVLVETIRAEMPDGWIYDMHSGHLAAGCNPAPQVTDVRIVDAESGEILKKFLF